MNKTIYHGSYLEVEFPQIRKHKFTKDFSWGFYCTEINEEAKKWASKFKTPIVNEYRLKNIEGFIYVFINFLTSITRVYYIS